jgi:hypothetical protein
MTGMKIVLPLAFSDTSLPTLRDDILLTDGSLLLVDPAHPANPWPTGTPSNAATLPNIAWKEAAAVIGSGSEEDMEVLFERNAAISGANGLVERSTRGGLHVVISESYAPAFAGLGVAIRPSQMLADYIVDNPNNSYYFSLWFKGTRFTDASESVLAFSLANTPSTTQLLVAMASTGSNIPTGGVKLLGARRTRTFWRPTQDESITPPFSDAIMSSIAVAGYTGTPELTGSSARDFMKVFSVGRMNPFAAATPVPSRMFWRAYIEDLTVSGRTFAEVDAIDYAEYQKQVLTVGGRYYGDTYTDPEDFDEGS